MEKLFAILILIAIILLVVVAFAASSTLLPPDLPITATDGETLALSSLLEEKDPVVLNIFKSWQSNSRTEVVNIRQMTKRLKSTML